jgi:predicted dehydrogenase
MTHTAAFVGFRHAHIFDVYDRMSAAGDFRIVACCEEDPEARKKLAAEGKIRITHDDFGQMLRTVAFGVCVIGDYYGKRGSLAVSALKAGRHVLSDKPVCTRMRELDAIASQAARGRLQVGAMLDMRDSGVFRRMREIARSGELGEILTITFNGNHPLLLGKRPSWYFKKEEQGGTINDLGIHAFDFIPWMTGSPFARVDAARSWSTGRAQSPHLRDAALIMGTLESGCGVMGELSYLVPDGIAYAYPDYWRFVVTGTRGVLAGSLNDKTLAIYREGATSAAPVDPAPAAPGGYLSSFLKSLEGRPTPEDLSTADVLDATRVSLQFQEAADKGLPGAHVSHRA